MAAKIGQQSAAQDVKDNIKQEAVKEEDNSSSDANTQIKEDLNPSVSAKKEEDEAEVFT